MLGRFRIRPIILAELIIIPGLAIIVLAASGAFHRLHPPPLLPDDPCPANRFTTQAQSPNNYTEESPPYIGVGPHPVALVRVPPDRNIVRLALYQDHDPIMPMDWKASEDPSKAQLVVCQYLTSAKPGKTICHYVGDVKVSLLESKYIYRIYEAKTARLVAAFDLKGDSSCPSDILYDKVEPPAMIRQVGDLTHALRPFVTRNVSGSQSP